VEEEKKGRREKKGWGKLGQEEKERRETVREGK